MNVHEPEDSITLCIRSLKAGDQGAVRSLWDRYFGKLVRLARSRLRNTPRAVRDEEDVALSAFHCLCRGASAGRFPQLRSRADLWRLLVTMVSQKVVDQRRHWRRAKRGGGQTIEAGSLSHDGAAADVLPQIAGREPSPDLAAASDEEYRRMLRQLGDPELCLIALWKLEGHNNDEITRWLGCGLRTVERKLRTIRLILSAVHVNQSI